MKCLTRITIFLLFLNINSSILNAFPLQGYSFLSPRSQSTDAARELVGWRSFINRGDIDGFYSAFAAMGMYQQSYRAYRIAEYFFGNNDLIISGSQNEQRANNALLADYFGLSPVFTSDVGLVPQITNAIFDLDWYLGYDRWYFRIHAPFVRSTTTFKLNELIHNAGDNLVGADVPFPALYMDFEAVTPPATSFAQAIQNQLTYGQVDEGLQYGRIACKQHKTGVSDVQLALGYNFVASQICHAGFNIRGSIPTGNRSQARYLLEPMVGNGHHWELGLGFTGHWILWERGAWQNFGVYLDINATHLFASTQVRSFDLLQNCDTNDINFGSRYILAKLFDGAGNYTGKTVPTINRTTLRCKTHHNFELDLACMFAYSGCWIDFDIGYEAWIRSKEHVCLLESLAPNTLALKGIQNVASSATVLSNDTQTDTATLNGNNFDEQMIVVDSPSPQFVRTEDLNLASAAAPTAFTNKIFWNISHSWKDELYSTCWPIPFLGIGGQFEFESLNPRAITEPNQNSVSQWAVWVKGGVAF